MELLAILAPLLCLARCDAVLPEPRAPIDTQGVVELVSSFLSGSTSGVCVHGKNRALGLFLRQLPPETARLHTTSWNFPLTQHVQLAYGDNMFLITADSAAQLADTVAGTRLPALSRVLLWTWADSAPSAGDVRALGVVDLVWLFQKQAVLAVSTPDGATSLFSLRSEGKFDDAETRVVAEIDRWSPRAQRWQRQSSPFTSLCSTWRSSEPAPRYVLAIRPDRHVKHPQPYIDLLTAIANSLGLRVEWRDEDASFAGELRNRSLTCTLPAVFSFRSGPLWVRRSLSYEFFALNEVKVVVPAGLDPHATLLQAVTDEFSAGLWCATAAAVLGVAVATALAVVAVLGRPLVAALATAPLQTLAPLLGQAPPGRTAHRPLSAVWLLMSVVLAAAYQGLLLRELTTPPGEINSLEQLEDSGLSIRMSKDLFGYGPSYLSDTLRSRMTFVSSKDLQSAVRIAADGRDTAVILPWDLNSELLLSPYLMSKSHKLHSFQLGAPYLSAKLSFTSGSPLREALIRTNAWCLQHGLRLRMVRELVNHNRPDVHAKNDEGLARALSLRQLRPAFLLLAYCYGVSAAVLVGEIIYHKWFDRRGEN
ncbi:Ionotropic receptor 134 [Frankliniella occidentalis]|nr:Ionotropic receptor 134 [Frankliniella occidentalis]